MIVNVVSEANILGVKRLPFLVFVSGVSSAVNHFNKMMDEHKIEYKINSIKDDCDILDVHTIGPFSLYLIKKAKKNKRKVVIHSHTTVEDMKNTIYLGNSDLLGLRNYIKKFYSLADVVVSPSEYTKNLLRQNYGLKNKITVISNGVNVADFKFSGELREEYRKKFGLNNFTVFSVGHVFKRKGIRSFITVGRVLNDLDFIWYGPTYLRLNSIIETSNLPENVKFPGYVENIRAAYSSGDIFFFPTYEENQGIVMLEAASCRRPIVVRDLPVFDEFKNKVHCLKASDNNGFIDCISELSENKKLRERLSNNAYDLVSKKHDFSVVGKKFLRLLKSLV